SVLASIRAQGKGKRGFAAAALPARESPGRAIWTGEDDGVAIGIMQPDFPVVGAAAAVGRIAVARQDDLGIQLCNSDQCLFEVYYLKPEQHAVAIGPVLRIPDSPMVVLHLKAVELHDQHVVLDQPLILAAAVVRFAPQQPLIPPAA